MNSDWIDEFLPSAMSYKGIDKIKPMGYEVPRPPVKASKKKKTAHTGTYTPRVKPPPPPTGIKAPPKTKMSNTEFIKMAHMLLPSSTPRKKTSSLTNELTESINATYPDYIKSPTEADLKQPWIQKQHNLYKQRLSEIAAYGEYINSLEQPVKSKGESEEGFTTATPSAASNAQSGVAIGYLPSTACLSGTMDTGQSNSATLENAKAAQRAADMAAVDTRSERDRLMDMYGIPKNCRDKSSFTPLYDSANGCAAKVHDEAEIEQQQRQIDIRNEQKKVNNKKKKKAKHTYTSTVEHDDDHDDTFNRIADIALGAAIGSSMSSSSSSSSSDDDDRWKTSSSIIESVCDSFSDSSSSSDSWSSSDSFDSSSSSSDF